MSYFWLSGNRRDGSALPPVKPTPHYPYFFWAGLLLTGLALAGCQVSTSTPLPPEFIVETDPVSHTPTVISVTETQTRTLPVVEPQPVSQPESISLPIPSPVQDPLRFVFPTPSQLQVSAWRPPLYPTPWAPTPYDHFYFTRPIAADEVNWALADYRYGGVFLPNVVHTGIDIPAKFGTPVIAAGPGRIFWAGYGLYRGVDDPTDPYGLAVVIKHDFGYLGEPIYTVYGHLDRIDVLIGQHVEPGEEIGLVGQTGKVTGPHLHFEVRIGRNNFFVSRNPELWLAPPQGWGVLAARLMNTSGELLPEQQVKVISKDSGQTWYVNSYGKGAANSDPYYLENLVLGDLPAGIYTIWLPYEGTVYDQALEIYPGMVSYFSFRGKKGFKTELPPTPGAAFTPPSVTLSPEP